MESEISKYLIEEKKIESAASRERLMQKVLKYDDIAAEFLQWLQHRNYAASTLAISGYKAIDIYTMAPTLDGIGVYNFMVTLRDNPDTAREIIKSKFATL